MSSHILYHTFFDLLDLILFSCFCLRIFAFSTSHPTLALFPLSLCLPEVCQPCKHVVMMRPDLLALSLLATHQPVSLLQSATNLSDYIFLSGEAL